MAPPPPPSPLPVPPTAPVTPLPVPRIAPMAPMSVSLSRLAPAMSRVDSLMNKVDIASPHSITPSPDEVTATLTIQLATDMMLDRHLKPRRTKFRYNDLPPRTAYISKDIEDLKQIHRRLIYRRFQDIERTFGPDVCAYQTPQEIIAVFRDHCADVERMCVPSSEHSQAIAHDQLKRLYTEFETRLDTFYDGLLNHELEARYDLEMRQRRRRKTSPQVYNFYFVRGILHRFYKDGPEGAIKHESITIFPVPELTVRRRLIHDSFQLRSQHTEALHVFRLLSVEVERISKHKTSQMDRMLRALKNKYRSGVFEKLCRSIDRQAKVIIRRFGYDFFFEEKGDFNLFLHHWAGRYCKVANAAWEKAMNRKTWALEIGKVLYAFLEFLKVSHDALLERDVDARLLDTIDILKEKELSVIPDISKFTVRRGSIEMVSKNDHDSRQTLAMLMNLNEIAAAMGEKEGHLAISPIDLTLPFDDILLQTGDEDEGQSYDEISNNEYKWFTPLRDDDLDPVWHTRPKNGQLRDFTTPRASNGQLSGPSGPRSTSRQRKYPLISESPTASEGSPSLVTGQAKRQRPHPNAQTQNARIMAPRQTPSKQARTATSGGSSPASTLASKTRDPAANKSHLDNGNSKSSPISSIRTPAVDQHTLRTSKFPDQSRQDSTAKVSYQIDEGAEQQHEQYGATQQYESVGAMNGFKLCAPSKTENDQMDPRSRLNKYLNDPNISITQSLSRARRPGEPFWAPRPDLAAHIRRRGEVEKKKEEESAQEPPRYLSQEEEEEEEYQHTVHGALARQLESDVLYAGLNTSYPHWPDTILGIENTLEDSDWAGRPMPGPESAREYEKLTDEEFEIEVGKMYG